MREKIDQIEKMKFNGYTYDAIAKELGVSRQRIQQLFVPNKKTKTALIERSGERCERCNKPLDGRGHIHHKLLPSLGINNIDNLEYLCIPCHMFAHAGTRKPLVEPTNRRTELAVALGIKCKRCQSENINKSGQHNGKQRYACRDCGHFFTL